MAVARQGEEQHHENHFRYRAAHPWVPLSIISCRAAPWVSLTVTLLFSNARGFELTGETPCQINHEEAKCDPRSISADPADHQEALMQVWSDVEHVYVEPVDRYEDSDEVQSGHGFADGGDLSGLSALVRTVAGLSKPKWRMKSSVKGRGRHNFGYAGDDGNHTQSILNISCGSAISAGDIGDASCPRQCPYLAEREVVGGRPCFFKCVSATDCGTPGTDPEALVPDSNFGTCRRCFIAGCAKCAPFGADVCVKCSEGYSLRDGRCISTGRTTWIIMVALSSVLAAFVLVWLVDLFCRTSVNFLGVEEGDAYRMRSILRQEQPAALEHAAGSSRVSADGESRSVGPHPLTTNLTRTAVAGRGTLLFFNFQLALIVWSALLLLGWYSMAVLVNGCGEQQCDHENELFTLGTNEVFTPKEFCQVIHWGYEKQHSLMWVKWSFCFGSYALSFILALVYSAKQAYTYEKLDAEQTTMMDYAAHVWDLPKESGSAKVEDELQTIIGIRSGEKVVGVSVCWDTSSSSIDVDGEADDIGRRLSINARRSAVFNQDEFPEENVKNPIRKIFNWVDSIFCSQPRDDGTERPSRADIVQALRDTSSTGHAFVVFETEAARDAAVRLAEHTNGFAFKGCQMQLEACTCEPTSVLWQNFNVDDTLLPMRMFTAAVMLLVLLIMWVFVFFLPAARFVAQYSDSKGESPEWIYTTLFMLLVIIGNQIMYTASDIFASLIGFKQEDARQSAYVVMYVTACTVNVVMDFVFLAKTSYREMIALGVRTDDGTEIRLLDSWNEIFEAYAMQRDIGKRLAEYAWPSTFLFPFMMEGLLTNMLPYILQRNLVRSKKGIVGQYAEKTMMHFAPMDLSRYGDILLNVMLTVLMFFLPPGYLYQIIMSMLLSHIYIYLYDHWRVLRLVPAFTFNNNHMHKAAECLLAVPVGLLLVTGVFKSNCQVLPNGINLPCSQDWILLGRCLLVFVLHVCLHLYLLFCVIPRKLTGVTKEPSTIQYDVAAQKIPQTWFTTNAMHCLRSVYIYNHSEPHIRFRHGME